MLPRKVLMIDQNTLNRIVVKCSNDEVQFTFKEIQNNVCVVTCKKPEEKKPTKAYFPFYIRQDEFGEHCRVIILDAVNLKGDMGEFEMLVDEALNLMPLQGI